MQDDDSDLLNRCLDFVTLERNEAFPAALFKDHEAGEWARAGALCGRLGLDADGLPVDLVVTWLREPIGDDEYALVLFYDVETLWSASALYHRQRLAAKPALDETDAARVAV